MFVQVSPAGGKFRAVASLEKELEIPLLVRDRDEVDKTSAFGQKVLQSVRSVLNSIARIEQVAAAERGKEFGNVRVGTFPGAEARLLPQIVARYEKSYPRHQNIAYDTRF